MQKLEIKMVSLSKSYIFIIILLASGFLLLTDDKRAGIPFIRELLILIIFLHVSLRLFLNRWYFKTAEENFILIYVFSFLILSSVNSYLFHDQPLLYSLLEERRLLQFLFFFTIFWALLKSTITVDEIVRFLIIAFLITSFWGYLYYFNIIPNNASPDFAKDFREAINSNDIRTQTRYMVGTTWLTIIFTFSVLKIREAFTHAGHLNIKYVLLVLYILLFVWLVVQTRSSMLTLAIIFIIVLRKYLLTLFLRYGFIVILLALIMGFIFQDWVVMQIDKFNILFEEATQSAGPRVREITAGIILNEIKDSYYFGQGALSLQWHGGFGELYNPNFYLSDVGIFGIYYRFGFLAPIFILGFYVFLFLKLFNFRNQHLIVKAYLYVFIVGVPSLIMSPQMAYGGFSIGLILAITAFLQLNMQSKNTKSKPHTKTFMAN